MASSSTFPRRRSEIEEETEMPSSSTFPRRRTEIEEETEMPSSSTLPRRRSEIESPSTPPPSYQGDWRWNTHMNLYRAAQIGDWDMAESILVFDNDAFLLRIGPHKESALHVAVAAGKSDSFVSKLIQMIPDGDDSILSLKDAMGNTLLHAAIAAGNCHATDLLLHRFPKLLTVSNDCNRFPHQLAAEYGHKEVLRMLITKAKENGEESPFDNDGGLQLILWNLAFYLLTTYRLIYLGNLRFLGAIFRRIASKDTSFSVERQRSFWKRIHWRVNEEKYEGVLRDIESQITVLSNPIVEKDSNLCRQLLNFMFSNERIQEKILLHHTTLKIVKLMCYFVRLLDYKDAFGIFKEAFLTAAKSENHEVVQAIVENFPLAVHTTNSSGQNFLLLAVENRCANVFNLIHKSSKYSYQYSNTLDKNGNSIHHLAGRLAPPHKLNLISGAALQMQRELHWFQETRKFVAPYIKELPNHSGDTASMIFTREHEELKNQGERWMKDTATACSVTAGLIGTAMFAAAITVPGGNDSNSGYPILNKSVVFKVFAVADGVSLFTSMISLLMFKAIHTSRYAEEDFLYTLPKRLSFGMATLFLSIFSMMMAFSAALYLVFCQEKKWAIYLLIPITFIPIVSFLRLEFRLFVDLVFSTYGRGVFGKPRGLQFS